MFQDACGFEERLEDGLEDSFDGYESIDSASVALEWRVLSREQDTYAKNFKDQFATVQAKTVYDYCFSKFFGDLQTFAHLVIKVKC